VIKAHLGNGRLREAVYEHARLVKLQPPGANVELWYSRSLLVYAQQPGVRLPDRLDPLDAAVRIGLGECDLLLLSGGVSLGDFDYIPEVLSKNGVEKLFHNLAMKPGKPTYLGRRGNTFVLGLPGNPVSTYVNFEIMAKAVLARLRGLPVESRVVRARMADDISRRDTERVEFLPVRYSAGEIHALRYTGSSMLNVLSEANALIRLEIGQAELERGTETDARLL